VSLRKRSSTGPVAHSGPVLYDVVTDNAHSYLVSRTPDPGSERHHEHRHLEIMGLCTFNDNHFMTLTEAGRQAIRAQK